MRAHFQLWLTPANHAMERMQQLLVSKGQIQNTMREDCCCRKCKRQVQEPRALEIPNALGSGCMDIPNALGISILRCFYEHANLHFLFFSFFSLETLGVYASTKISARL
jgi:hypothetical protein